MANLQEIITRTHNENPPSPPSWSTNSSKIPLNIRDITQQCINTFLASPGSISDGGINGIGWWQAANAYTAMALHDLWANKAHSDRSKSPNYDLLTTQLRACEKVRPGFINEFNDDSLWWALACMHVYSLGGDPWFLDKAKGVWRHVVESGSVCKKGQHFFQGKDMEGACFWTTKRDEEQINSISTGLFAELSLRIALLLPDDDGNRDKGIVEQILGNQSKNPLKRLLHHTPSAHHHHPAPSKQDCISYARSALTWILTHRSHLSPDPGSSLILDNILLRQQVSNDWTFTYTTGVTIAALALLYATTKDPASLTLACVFAQSAMKHNSWVESHNGVLSAPSEYGPGKDNAFENGDAVGFKAVLIRGLGVLCDFIHQTGAGGEARETAELIKAFIQANMQSQLERNTNHQGQYGPWWNGPFESPTSHSQMAVLDVMAVGRLIGGG